MSRATGTASTAPVGRLGRNERLNRKNISLLLTWADGLVAAEMDDAEGLNTTTKISKVSVV